VCREAVPGGCDIEERCTGKDAECPADKVEPSTKVCRPANGVCDVAEMCTGTSNTCPTNGYAGSSQQCGTATTHYRCSSDDDCGAATQQRVTASYCDGSGPGESACKQDDSATWTTVKACDAASEICVPGATSTQAAVCVPCDDAFAPDNACKDSAVLYDYDGSVGECVNNTCDNYAPVEVTCDVTCADGACADPFPCNEGNSRPKSNSAVQGDCIAYTHGSGKLHIAMYGDGPNSIVLRIKFCDGSIERFTINKGTTAHIDVPSNNCPLFIHVEVADKRISDFQIQSY
jgi:hypothetical protein